MDNILPTIEEAIRVIKALDDKSHLYLNQRTLIQMSLSEDEHYIQDQLEDAFDEVIEQLKAAEEARQELLHLLNGYRESLTDEDNDEPEKYVPKHPMLRRSGKR